MRDEEVIMKMLEHIEHKLLDRSDMNVDKLYGYRIERGQSIKKLKVGLDNSMEHFLKDNKGAWVCLAFVRMIPPNEQDPLDKYFEKELK